MIKTIKEIIKFQNKYITLFNNEVESHNGQKFFHIRIEEGENGKNNGVIIITKYKDKYLMLNSYRYGIDENIWEFPRGYKNKGESSEFSAQRELKEETNLDDIKSIQEIGKVSTNPSIINNEINIVLIELNSIDNLILQDEEFIKNKKFVKIIDIETKDAMTLSALSILWFHENKI